MQQSSLLKTKQLPVKKPMQQTQLISHQVAAPVHPYNLTKQQL